MVVAFAQWASATLYNGLARYDRALAAAEQASEHPLDWRSHLTLHELIEAAVRNGTPERGAATLERLSQTTGASGSNWALAIEARSRALLSEGHTADALYVEALDRLAPLDWVPRLPALTSSMANGCDASAAGWTHASSYVQLMKCSSPWERKLSPSAPGSSSRRLERPYANGSSRPPPSSLPRKPRFAASPQKAPGMQRSGRAFSSARAPSTTTFEKRFASSASVPALSSSGAWLSRDGPELVT